MREITITPSEIERLASQALAVPTDIDLGPSPNGGRYYLTLGDGIDGAVASRELETFVRDALRGWFEQRRTDIRHSLAERIRNERRANREVAEFVEPGRIQGMRRSHRTRVPAGRQSL